MAQQSAPHPADPVVRHLERIRLRYKRTYKRYAPGWRGESYGQPDEYPDVPATNAEALAARAAIIYCDYLLSILETTRTPDGYVMTPRQLAEFASAHGKLWSVIQLEGPLKSFTLAGIKRKMTSKSAIRKANETKAAKRPDYLSAVSKLMETGMRYTPACARVASAYSCEPLTVRNHTPELRPGKRPIKR